jgi:hypothetical protein
LPLIGGNHDRGGLQPLDRRPAPIHIVCDVMICLVGASPPPGHCPRTCMTHDGGNADRVRGEVANRYLFALRIRLRRSSTRKTTF